MVDDVIVGQFIRQTADRRQPLVDTRRANPGLPQRRDMGLNNRLVKAGLTGGRVPRYKLEGALLFSACFSTVYCALTMVLALKMKLANQSGYAILANHIDPAFL